MARDRERRNAHHRFTLQQICDFVKLPTVWMAAYDWSLTVGRFSQMAQCLGDLAGQALEIRRLGEPTHHAQRPQIGHIRLL